MKSKLLKGGLTVVGAIAVSSLGLFAADRLQGIDRSLVGLVGVGTSSICPKGAVPLLGGKNTICVDEYEVSPSDGCPNTEPVNILESEDNANNSNCYGASVSDAKPWRYISLSQAQRVCARSGKRLPTSDEWYRAALGTDPSSCNLNSSEVANTGNESCKSTIGADDLVGNVWEWVNENVVNAKIGDQQLPQEGYVTSVDASGMAITTGESANDLYGADYFWSKSEGVYGMLRGGFYGSKTDGGLYTVNAAVQTSFASQGVGFRCVEDV